MPHFRLAPVFAACLTAWPLFAGAQPANVRPGAWNVIAGAEGGPRTGYQICFKTGDANDIGLLLPRAAGGPACNAASSRMESGTLIWELLCPAAHFSVAGRYTLSPERIEGKVNIVSGDPPQTQVQLISASHAGACPAP